MKTRGYLITAALAATLVFSPGAATESAAADKIEGRNKTEDIMRLMELRGEDRLPAQVLNGVIPELKKVAIETPDSFWENVKKNASGKELIDKIVAMYDEHMSHEHIIATLDFYETPAGQQLIEATPHIAVEAMKEGRKWGNEVASDIFMLLADEGYVSPKAGRGAH